MKEVNGNPNIEKYNNQNKKNSLCRLKSRVEMTGEGISKFEERSIEFTQSEQQRK